MADSRAFVLQKAIRQILDNPSSRPKLPNQLILKDETSTGGGVSVGGAFKDPKKYDSGLQPDIALNNSNVAVEVHMSESQKSGRKNKLWYSVGKTNGKEVDWNKSQEYGDGMKPSVGISNGGQVVEVHQSENKETLWYRVGFLSGSTITWTAESAKYDNGERPSVAVNDSGRVVEVHQSENEKTLWYRIGIISGNSISWMGNSKYDTGIRPSVAVNDSGQVVEVHQSENADTLWYRVGQVTGSAIEWEKSYQYDNGKRPSVAITDEGLAVEVHQSENADTLWHSFGNISNGKIEWNKSREYGRGVASGVACNREFAVETHSSDETLSSSVLTLPASQPKWTKTEGDYSALYFEMREEDLVEERVFTSETITIKPSAPLLVAILTRGEDSTEFPKGAMLSITGPNGVVYGGKEAFTSSISIDTVGRSLQSLVIKEPESGDYTVSLAVPPNTTFFFGFATLPFSTLTQVGQSNRLQKRGGPDQIHDIVPVAVIANVWINAGMTGQLRRVFREILHRGLPPRERMPVAAPGSLDEAIDVIAQPIIPFAEAILPPAGEIETAPIDGPVREYIRNGDGAVQWLHAEIRPQHIRRGTRTTDDTREFAQRLGLQGDDAGHIVGLVLGGRGDQVWNIFPQLPHLNRGANAAHIESLMREGVEDFGAVSAWYRFYYGDPSRPNRPTRYGILFRLPNGIEYVGDLYNPETNDS